MDFDKAVEELNKVATNLGLLKNKWDEIQELLDYASRGNWGQEEKEQYDTKCLEFEDILESIPKIRGVEIQNVLPDYYAVSQEAKDVLTLDEPEVSTSFYSEIYSQGSEISKYEYHLKRERRELIRKQVESCINDFGDALDSLSHIIQERDRGDQLEHREIEPLKYIVSQIDSLMGDSVQKPPRWSDLERHLGFGQVQDLDDIITLDWPAIKPALQSSFRGSDPIPTKDKDLGDLVDHAGKSGEVPTNLNWAAITPEQFENLCTDLLDSSPNWENVTWLTHTNASDRGRDIKANWVIKDETRGTVREKCLIQCRHKIRGSVSASDIHELSNILRTHGNFDIYIIITSGKFTDGAIQSVESHNESDRKPTVEIWNDWKLERLLASHPELIQKYGLR